MIPTTFEDALDFLENQMAPGVVQDVVNNMSENDFTATYHHSVGRDLRNDWGFWKGDTPLAQWFHSIGIKHADDMSGIILTSLHRRIRGLPINLDAQVKHYRDYWTKENPSYL